jgi:anti-sigma regulatory factor (Ser/Thr protein kinase)
LSGFEHAAIELRALLDDRQVKGDPRFKIELAFEEVVTNVVRHGRPTGDVEVTVRFGDDEIALTFEDDGPPFDPLGHPQPAMPASIDDMPLGGLGLVLLTKMYPRLSYERTGRERNLLTLAVPVR